MVGLVLDCGANLLDKFEQIGFVEQHCLVVVVHLLQEIDAPHIFLQMVANHRNVRNETGLYVLEVPYQTHQEFIGQMQQF